MKRLGLNCLQVVFMHLRLVLCFLFFEVVDIVLFDVISFPFCLFCCVVFVFFSVFKCFVSCCRVSCMSVCVMCQRSCILSPVISVLCCGPSLHASPHSYLIFSHISFIPSAFPSLPLYHPHSSSSLPLISLIFPSLSLLPPYLLLPP